MVPSLRHRCCGIGGGLRMQHRDAEIYRRQGFGGSVGLGRRSALAGCTTSGCVRATVVDAMSHNFRTLVVRDCVGDRSLAAHEASVFDMEQKYADLIECK